jgi:protein-L-isoaspartate(D-aspartate) O-methyltransferase
VSASDFSAARDEMVEQQLRPRGIRDPQVLEAMRRVPREAFVPESILNESYLDGALPIDCNQTISQPVIVAMMTEALQLSRDDKVLEIGTGSGYQTAILAELAGEVFSIERHAELTRQAETRLNHLGYRNVWLRTGDGSLGWPDAAPFDRILITAAAAECPPALWDQLREGGILVGPFGPPSDQVLYELHKIGGQPRSKALTDCRFVPLVTSS